ncbi:galectin-1-like [Colossoma macropomum]|uniref:galectin-1-like n=1 Tax=Colossoma macropomum TaxID=42526 RepID=UPI0018651101|nr:galectin-1-like [Colossoma macropomum]
MINICVNVWKRFSSLTRAPRGSANGITKISEEVEMKNVLLRAGDQLKVQGKIHADAKRFQIDLGSSELALHFNPCFYDDNANTAVLVCNSQSGGIWDQEQRDTPNPFQPGSTFKVVVKHTGKVFEVKLPDEQATELPSRQGVEVISSIHVKGDISLTAFKMY